mgnify:CR=1 FL=1
MISSQEFPLLDEDEYYQTHLDCGFSLQDVLRMLRESDSEDLHYDDLIELISKMSKRELSPFSLSLPKPKVKEAQFDSSKTSSHLKKNSGAEEYEETHPQTQEDRFAYSETKPNLRSPAELSRGGTVYSFSKNKIHSFSPQARQNSREKVPQNSEGRPTSEYSGRSESFDKKSAVDSPPQIKSALNNSKSSPLIANKERLSPNLRADTANFRKDSNPRGSDEGRENLNDSISSEQSVGSPTFTPGKASDLSIDIKTTNTDTQQEISTNITTKEGASKKSPYKTDSTIHDSAKMASQNRISPFSSPTIENNVSLSKLEPGKSQIVPDGSAQKKSQTPSRVQNSGIIARLMTQNASKGANSSQSSSPARSVQDSSLLLASEKGISPVGTSQGTTLAQLNNEMQGKDRLNASTPPQRSSPNKISGSLKETHSVSQKNLPSKKIEEGHSSRSMEKAQYSGRDDQAGGDAHSKSFRSTGTLSAHSAKMTSGAHPQITETTRMDSKTDRYETDEGYNAMSSARTFGLRNSDDDYEDEEVDVMNLDSQERFQGKGYKQLVGHKPQGVREAAGPAGSRSHESKFLKQGGGSISNQKRGQLNHSESHGSLSSLQQQIVKGRQQHLSSSTNRIGSTFSQTSQRNPSDISRISAKNKNPSFSPSKQELSELNKTGPSILKGSKHTTPGSSQFSLSSLPLSGHRNTQKTANELSIHHHVTPSGNLKSFMQTDNSLISNEESPKRKLYGDSIEKKLLTLESSSQKISLKSPSSSHNQSTHSIKSSHFASDKFSFSSDKKSPIAMGYQQQSRYSKRSPVKIEEDPNDLNSKLKKLAQITKPHAGSALVNKIKESYAPTLLKSDMQCATVSLSYIDESQYHDAIEKNAFKAVIEEVQVMKFNLLLVVLCIVCLRFSNLQTL